MIIWLTGQPGAGKTTLAKLLEAYFSDQSVIIDGDDLRELLKNTDYSENGRRKNIEYAQNMAKDLYYNEYNVIVSLVSPYKDQRELFKQDMGSNIKEVYVHTSNIRGKEHFHVQNYEAPTENFVEIDTTDKGELETLQELVQKLNL
jgi:adenylylsulfate kinase-like enzyme